MKWYLPLLISLAACAPSATTTQRITVSRGASLRTVADSLSAHGLIVSRPWFRLRARLAGVDRAIQVGIYEFPARSSVGQILHRLKTGDAVLFRVTLPIGGTIWDLARSAQNALHLSDSVVLSAARDTSRLRRFGIPGPTVEGWLRPESYDFGAFTTAAEVVERFVTARLGSWDTTWDSRARAAGLDRAGLLTLASIVEAEALDTNDRPLIAAVYRNRLQRRMPLQADPTIQYAYLLRDGARKGRLFLKDYSLPSEWNTYLIKALPPGPIGNPSNRAIEASLSPAPVPYLYFVAGPDGRHLFSRSYSEHLRAISRVRSAARPPQGREPPVSR